MTLVSFLRLFNNLIKANDVCVFFWWNGLLLRFTAVFILLQL